MLDLKEAPGVGRADEPKAAVEKRAVARMPVAKGSDRHSGSFWPKLWARRQSIIAITATAGIALHLFLRYGLHAGAAIERIPLLITLGLGGAPLVIELLVKLLRRQFGSDLLAGISIVTAALLGQYLAGALV